MKNIKLFMFIIPLLAGLFISSPSILHAETYTFNIIDLNNVYVNYILTPQQSDSRYAILITNNNFVLCANGNKSLNTNGGVVFNFFSGTVEGKKGVYYHRKFAYIDGCELLETNIKCFNNIDNLLRYLDTGEIIDEVDVNGNPLKDDLDIPIIDIKFLNYTNLGAQYAFICNVKMTETDEYRYFVNGNYKYKYFSHSLLTNIINHYGWQSEQEIYDAFKNDPQFIYKTDYNSFLQESRWYIDFTDFVSENVQQSLGVTGVPLIYKYYGYFPTSGHCVNEIYDDIDTFTDLEYLLACFTYYPYAWKNLVYPNDTIIFNWNVEDILNSHSVTIIQPDYDDDEDDDDINYTHNEDDYLGRTSDVLNYYQNEMNVESIDEASLILRNTFNCIPKDIRTIYIFFLVMASIIGLICIARE